MNVDTQMMPTLQPNPDDSRFEQLKDRIVIAVTTLPQSEATLKATLSRYGTPEWAVPYALESLLHERRIVKHRHVYHINRKQHLG
jgi:uncharacterized membrane protein